MNDSLYHIIYGATMFLLGCFHVERKQKRRELMLYNWKCPHCEFSSTFGSNQEEVLFKMVERHLEQIHSIYDREEQDSPEVAEAFYKRKWWQYL